MIKSKLKLRMVEREMTVTELSQRTGLGAKAISLFRNSRLLRFDGAVLGKLCQALNCQVGDLLAYIPDAQDKKPQKARK